MTLKDQVAIVTGGTAGIGKAIALLLAKEGATVIVFGTHAERGKLVMEELERVSPVAAAHELKLVDVSSTQAVSLAIEEIFSRFNKVDILINNAGITLDQLLMKMSEEDWDRVIDVNLKSVYNFSKGVIRSMLKARYGRIVNISSVVGLTGNAGQVNYAASKAGMIGLTKALAQEVASRGITVNCIAPGFIVTPMTDKLTVEQKESIEKKIPMGRLGEPDDIARAVLFFVSRSASYITGQVLPVDGGMVM